MTEWIERHADTGMPAYVESFEPEPLTPGRHHLAVRLIEEASGRAVRLPMLVIKGEQPGPIFGLTAALHGNELNGIPVIHGLFETIKASELKGIVAAVVIANVPGYLANTRKFRDGADLNRLMPGRPHGNESQIYAHRLLHNVVAKFNYLVDLHTASFGRVNSLYVRADMTDPMAAKMARLVGPEIILHNTGSDTTLRGAAQELGIHAITIEVGDPQVFERRIVRASRIGVRDIIEDLGMLPADAQQAEPGAIELAKSYWLYTDTGGILRVVPDVCAELKKGDVIATLVDAFGRKLRTYRAPEDGVVVGKSTNPVAHTGARILHLGVRGMPERAESAPDE